jgi:hypothetical protein
MTIMKKYHGWIIVEKNSPGFKDVIYAETGTGDQRTKKQMGYGESGCAAAVEWFDQRVGKTISIVPMGKIGYRVYTEEEAE